MSPLKTNEMIAHDARKDLIAFLEAISEGLKRDHRVGVDLILEQAKAFPGRILPPNEPTLFGWSCRMFDHRISFRDGVPVCAFCGATE